MGTLAWAVDVDKPATREHFTVTLKEVALPGPGDSTVNRPCAIGFSGNYPRAYDGLARLLSLDMRVIDPAWIGMKLRKLLNVGEPLGHFMAPVPGERRQQVWPSTVAFIARLVIQRYAMPGKPCPECGNHSLIRKDGCEFCTACGHVGQCG